MYQTKTHKEVIKKCNNPNPFFRKQTKYVYEKHKLRNRCKTLQNINTQAKFRIRVLKLRNKLDQSKLKDIKDLCEYIWFLEEKYDLFNLEINGVHPWAAYRMDLYYEIGKRHRIFDKDLNMKLSRKEKAINFFRLLKQSLINNPHSNLHQVDALVFSSSRSKLVNKILIDPYTYYLKEDLIKNNISFLEFESPYKGKHLREKKDYKRYLDSILIYRNIKNLFISTSINKKNRTTLYPNLYYAVVYSLLSY